MLLLITRAALALDADTFEISGSVLDEQGGLQVVSPSLGQPNGFYGGLGVAYALDPIVRRFDDGTEEAVVSTSFATHLLGGYTIGTRARIDLDVPLYPFIGAPDADFSGFHFGDLRLSGVVPMYTSTEKTVRLAVVPGVTLPTGSTEAYTGAGGFGGALALAGGIDVSRKAFVNANLGLSAGKADSIGDFELGSGLTAGLGAGARVSDSVLLGAEVDSLFTLTGGIGPFNKNPVEIHGYGTYGTGSGITGTLGVGTGLVAGVGAPDVRVLLAVGYHAPGAPPVYDRDKDGVVDATDQCVDVPEDLDGFEDTNGCPDPDNDRDGILDDADSCRFDAEDVDEFEDTDGCPDKDNDADGLTDFEDACPNVAGPKVTAGCPDRDGDTVADDKDECPDVAGVVTLAGCPDRDNDLVPDKRDACPDKARDPREDPARSDGCPKRVIVTREKIEILEKIFFDTNKATIKPVSFPLLKEIAATLNSNPDIIRLEIAGHTDTDGKDDKNLKLSQARAEAVVKYLTTTGEVEAGRLFAVGYGETVPMDTNATTEGKGNNRRVEFVIRAIRPAGPATP